jgi:hypothetical protein
MDTYFHAEPSEYISATHDADAVSDIIKIVSPLRSASPRAVYAGSSAAIAYLAIRH